MDETFMKNRRVVPLVLSMSLPMMVSMLVMALYNIVDSYFIAKISEDAMTAISLVYPIQNLITAVAVGYGVGVNATAAYYMGAGDKVKADDTASMGVYMSVVHGLVLTVLCEALTPWFLALFTDDAAVLGYGTAYAAIVVAFSVPITAGIAYEKLFQAQGKMKTAMASMIAGCVVNVVLDPILIFGWGVVPAMNSYVVALVTDGSQVVPLVIYCAVQGAKPMQLHVRWRRGMWNRRLMGQAYAVGVPAALNIALPSLLITALNGILVTYSTAYVLILGIYYKLQTFIYLPANGIVQGIRPIVGYNYGAGEYDRVHQIFRTALTLSAGVMVVGTAICVAFAGALVGIFSHTPETVALGKTALRIISMGFVVSSLSVSIIGVLEGLGQGGLSLSVSLMRYIVVIIPLAYAMSRLMGAQGVWHAFPMAEAITACSAWVMYEKRVRRKLLKK